MCGDLTGLIAKLLRLESDVGKSNRRVWFFLISCSMITLKKVIVQKKSVSI